MNADPKNTALVVGGGLAGMQASLVLAERGHRVVLLD
ncbi:MAG: FAD-binding protein, partial [Deltaproteobacteria bacterium]|nr:FAD-binding protein [Deltaproteobacteria bacterium]